MMKLACTVSCLLALTSGTAIAQSSAAGAMEKYRREQAIRAQIEAEAAARAKQQAAQQAAEKRARAINAAEQRKAEAARQAELAQEARERQRATQIKDQLSQCEAAIERSDWEDAADPCKTAASLGNPKAQYYTAKLTRDGLGMPQDYKAAALLFVQSTKGEFIPAFAELCKMLRDNQNPQGPKFDLAAQCLQKLDRNDYDPYYNLAGEGERNIREEAKDLLVDMYFNGQAAPPVPRIPAQAQTDPEFRMRVWERVATQLPGGALINAMPFGKFASMMSYKWTAKLWIEEDSIKLCRAQTKKQDPKIEKLICQAIEAQNGSSIHIRSAVGSRWERVGGLVEISM